MRTRSALACLALLWLCGPCFAGSATAPSDLSAPSLTWAKAGDSPDLQACKAKCRKDYRRCYSQGNQVGKPDVPGGQPCSEQKVECMRACQQQQ